MPLAPLANFDIAGQNFAVQDLAVVGLLVVLEGLLSIDNALVLGLLAKRLPKHEQSKALLYGLVGAFVFRFMAVLLASFLLQWTFAKLLGGAYLVYIAVRHLFFEAKEEGGEKIVLDEAGQPSLVDEATGGPLAEEAEELEIKERVPVYMDAATRKRLGLARFWPTVLIIELTDIAFAVDSILAAIAMVGGKPKGTPADALHPKLWVVVLGGIIGLMLMRVAARMFIKLLDRFPRFEISAYLLVIVIGLKLLADYAVNSDWSFDSPKFVANRLGSSKQKFEELEERRRELVKDYEGWLAESWIFGLKGHSGDKSGENSGEESEVAKAADHDPLHVPHLLDFHTPRRPEFIVFWGLMAGSFAVGFLPKRK
jgi:YkoY family integral membrane protein